jgi:SAM-dependent methyltransferase
LLDAACGTGQHLRYLRRYYNAQGFDLDEEMLAIAHDRLPDLLLYHADLASFSLGKQFDVITCLFSAIGYVETEARLQLATEAFRRHLVKGGILIFEAWFSPEEYVPDTVHARFVDEPDLKIARMNVSRIEGTVSVLDFRYMVAVADGIFTFDETHRLGLFTDEQYRRAVERSGFKVVLRDPEGISGRSLYICEVVD